MGRRGVFARLPLGRGVGDGVRERPEQRADQGAGQRAEEGGGEKGGAAAEGGFAEGAHLPGAELDDPRQEPQRKPHPGACRCALPRRPPVGERGGEGLRFVDDEDMTPRHPLFRQDLDRLMGLFEGRVRSDLGPRGPGRQGRKHWRGRREFAAAEGVVELVVSVTNHARRGATKIGQAPAML
jgi:hypothetical protein